MPKTVMIVEDEPLLAMMVEDMLAEMGFAHSTPLSIEDAIERLDSTPPDFALVDLHVWGHRSDPLIVDLQRRGIPFAVMSGSDATEILSRFGNVPSLSKPFEFDSLEATLSQFA